MKLRGFLPKWNKHKVYRTLGFIPVIITLGLLLWSLVGNYRSVLPLIYDNSKALGVLWALFLTAIWILCMWSYLVCVFRNPGNPRGINSSNSIAAHGNSVTNGPYVRVPSGSAMGTLAASSHRSSRRRHADSVTSSTDGEDADESCSESGEPLTSEQMRQAELVYAITVKDNGQPRYCLKCQVPKPDRAHHCSTCGVCVLKMDHHCPWLNNCVGFHTHKPFLLFLLYTTLYCAVTFVSAGYFFYQLFVDPMGAPDVYVELIILCILAGPFALCLTGFFGYHVYLVAVNLTTIESYEGNTFRVPGGEVRAQKAKKINLFDVGWRKNVVQVMGTSRLQWMVPTRNSVGDGLRYSISYAGYNELRQN
ncbi:palmitoyltransferase for Vac8p [Coemansia sp. Benny D115]|nr:palmitoyltransferase for Vac8p [Coemansia sp. Benny D115]